ncbi:hypothetical protein AGDE_13715 [Angomonas deanei]|uniref:Uncharacterized protein n=1 Tax=Angomonas deanei TaxID=59799 RepID=A0A7G2C0K7_9TRYP|nr:hypothetical protein AGDE_13715 [Angomonas deanei]CAD2213219.1 hypothetical protein, conserved [Angomonas deanei]|eukprot:EPY21898.1 hypothetical protein AGDE_13715 [Angomonas deanei]
MDPIQYGAMYLGKYYFFSSKEFLSRFLDDPTEVADPQNLRPLPPLLPEVVKESVPLSKLEHQGCCPVVLYDTRDRRGLRGVIEPIAQKGSMDHLVRYDGKIYALLDDANMARFITCPWQFVEGASMPEYHKRPLDEGRNVSDVKDEEYIRRYLYDALSKAMKDVADIRPIYPDLTPEESALKYIALHMKAHNTSENNDIQSAQYAENFETFRTRSQLYQKSRKRSLQDSEEEKALFDQLCTEYEKLQYGVKSLHTLSQLSANGHNNI